MGEAGAPEYLPASQSAQVPPLAPVKPALHKQAVTTLLAAGELELALHAWHTSVVAPTVIEYWPAKQLLHAASPVAILYCPAMHSVHVSPLAPENPALHLQSDNSLLAAGASELVGHIKH